MQLALALASGLAVFVALSWLSGWLGRRVRLIGQLSLALQAGALAAALTVTSLFRVEGLDSLHTWTTWAAVFAITLATLRIAALYFFDFHLHTRRGLRLPPMLPAVTLWASYLIAAFAILKMAWPGLPVTALLTTSAVTSLVLGLALQPILGNFFAGLVIALERPFRINDWVKFGDIEGRVVGITWRTTHLRTRDNDNLVVPNGKIADQEILNYYYPHPLHLERVHVGAHYRTPPYRVEQALLDVATRVEGVLEKPSPMVYVISFDDSAITYELRLWIEDIGEAPRIASQARCEIWEEFRRRGITIPFPIRTLEIETRGTPLESLLPAKAERPAPSPGARLFVSRGPDRGCTLEITEATVTVGRLEESDLKLAAPQVSKEHVRIERHSDGYHLRDLGSHFGTKVNGTRVEKCRLADLDKIEIGEDVLVFELDH